MVNNVSHDALTKTSAMRTGKDDITKVTTFTQYQDSVGQLDFWNGCDAHSNQLANMINGTEGEQFSPGLASTDAIYVFTDDIMRSLRFLVQ